MSALETTHVDAARRLTERIRRVAQNVAEQVEDLRALVAEAKETEAHVVLGYASWTAYLADLFGDEPLRLARDVRRELVAELHDQGMSTRAIAPIVGVTQQQISKDLQVTTEASPAAPSWDVPDWARGTDRVASPQEVSAGAGGVIQRRKELLDRLDDAPKPITGLDGKTYGTPTKPPSEPKKVDKSRSGTDDRWALIEGMAADSRTPSEIARRVGLTEPSLRRLARERGVEFPADVLANRKRIKSEEVLEQIVLGLEVTESSLSLIRLEGITPEQATSSLERLASPLRAIRKLQNQLKEIK